MADSGTIYVMLVTRRRAGKDLAERLTLGQSFPSCGASTFLPGHGDRTRFSLRASLFALKWSGLICFHLKPHVFEDHQKHALIQWASGKTSPTEFCPDHKCSDFPYQSHRQHTHLHPPTHTISVCVSDNTNCLFLCRQVLRWGQVFPKKQHDFVSNGLWGGPAERELRDAGSIVGISWQQQSAPHFTQRWMFCCTWKKTSVCLLACNTF